MLQASYRLAFLLHKDVDDILSWPFQKIIGYFAYLEESPTDDWTQTALTCSVLANLWSKKKFQVSDFLPCKKKSTPLTKEGIAALFSQFPKRKPK